MKKNCVRQLSKRRICDGLNDQEKIEENREENIEENREENQKKKRKLTGWITTSVKKVDGSKWTAEKRDQQ
jgi:hypothetical protein